MKQNSRLTGRRIGAAAVLATVTACGGLALAPAAFADSTVATAQSTAHSATRSAVASPATISDCNTILEINGYALTVGRIVICGITGSTPWSNPATGIAWCTAALVGTGVGPSVAAFACTLAVIPG